MQTIHNFGFWIADFGLKQKLDMSKEQLMNSVCDLRLI